MARLKLVGKAHTAEITIDPEEGDAVVSCEDCSNRERYDDLRDAVEYGGDHVDLTKIPKRAR